MSEKELKLNKNTGFIPPPTLEEEPEQWLAGTIPYQVVKKNADWEEVKITEEPQRYRLFDAMMCVSSSETNTEEKQIQYFIDNGVVINGINYEIDVDKIKDWIDENGKVNLSERFLAKVSNTTTTGNSPMRVMDARRKFGLPPERMWSIQPFIDGNFNRGEFYKEIPQAVKDKALEWNKYWDIYYERLPENPSASVIKYHLLQAPIWWASATCPGWFGADIISACSLAPSHMHLGQKLTDKWKGTFDSYDPYDKKLAPNYKIYFPYKVVVVPKPLILKKKELENDMPKLYQATGKPELYVLGKQDALYHHIEDEPTFRNLFGTFNEVEIVQMAQIPDSQKGDPIAQVSAFAKLINNFLYSLKGK